MGVPGAWMYNKDVGSAIETAEAKIGKVKTNKYDNKDLVELAGTIFSVLVAVINNDEQED